MLEEVKLGHLFLDHHSRVGLSRYYMQLCLVKVVRFPRLVSSESCSIDQRTKLTIESWGSGRLRRHHVVFDFQSSLRYYLIDVQSVGGLFPAEPCVITANVQQELVHDSNLR